MRKILKIALWSLGILCFIILAIIGYVILSPRIEHMDCYAGGGQWKLMGNTCVDFCIPPDIHPACGTAMWWGCDCGSDKCWNGKTCVLNPK